MNPGRHFINIVSTLLILIAAACAQTPVSTPSENTSAAISVGCTNAYFPVIAGTSWSYSSSGSSKGNYTYTRTITDLSDSGFSTREQYNTGVNASVKWTCQDGNLAALNAGSDSLNMTTSNVKMTSNSITAEGYNIPANFDTGNTWSEKVTVNGTVTNGSSKTVTTQIVTELNCTATGTDTVTTPAGKFDAVKSTCKVTVAVSALIQGTPMPAGPAVTETITNWYAKGVGLVQSVRTGGTTAGTETILLTQYKIK